MKKASRTTFTGAILAVALLILVIQLYLFETVLGAVLDGERTQLPGAFWVSAILSVAALVLAFKAPAVDR